MAGTCKVFLELCPEASSLCLDPDMREEGDIGLSTLLLPPLSLSSGAVHTIMTEEYAALHFEQALLAPAC